MSNIVNLPTSPELTEISKRIRALADTHRGHVRAIQQAVFAMGAELLHARRLLPSNQAFGQWCDAQEWPDGCGKNNRWGAMNLANNRELAQKILAHVNSDRVSAQYLWGQVKDVAESFGFKLKTLREEDEDPFSLPKENAPDWNDIHETPASEPETPTIAPETPEKSAVAEKASNRSPFRALGQETADVLHRFYCQPNTRTLIGKIAMSETKAKDPKAKNIRRLVTIIESGLLGDSNHYSFAGAAGPSAKLLFQNIPPSVANLSVFKANDAKKFADLLDDAPRYAELSRLVAEWESSGVLQKDIGHRALRWWQTGSAETTPPEKLVISTAAPVVVTQDLSFLRPATPGWLQLVPPEAPIAVYGKAIWPMEPGGHYPSLSFMQVWAWVQIWQDLDRILTAAPSDARDTVGRGRALMAKARQFGWATNSREIAALWTAITTAQMQHPDREMDTRIPPQAPNTR